MVLVWITFIWLVLMIIYFGRKWIKERKEAIRIVNEESIKIGKEFKKYVGRHKK